jgi:arylsulfatase A-like enzyme
MQRYQIFSVLILGLMLGASGQVAAAPNILLIIGDDMGVDTLASYGIGENFPKTTALDELAQTGVRFTNTWSQAICSPTRATIMTGRYGFRTGIGWPVSGVGAEPPLPPRPLRASFEGPAMGMGMGGVDTHSLPTPGLGVDEFTLPMAFKSHPDLGYATAAIGKWHLADIENGWEQHPNRVGFDHFSGLIPGITASYFAWNKVVNGKFQPGVGYTPEDKANDAIAWIKDRGDDPWFMWLAFNLPHTPLHLPPDDNWQSDYSAMDRDGIEEAHSRAYFNAMIEAMDTQIGRVLDSMDPEVRNNTYVIFIGDNGTIGRWISPPYHSDRAKSTIYEGGINVPLIVSGPGVRAGGVSDALVNSSDLFFTIMEMAAIDPADAVPDDLVTDSVSFMPTLTDPNGPSPRDWIYADVFLGGFAGIADANYAIRNERYKLLRHERLIELYDLAEDPFENHDLLKGELSVAEEAAFASLQAQVRELRDSE